MTQDNIDCKEPVCGIIVVGERGVHHPWRLCSHCHGLVETIPERCPHCGCKVVAFADEYIRRKKIWFDDKGNRYESNF